jgi:prophage regulatory protein
MKVKLITRKNLKNYIPYSVSHIYRLEKAGQFPSRVLIGPKRVAYIESEIVKWVDDRIKLRGN